MPILSVFLGTSEISFLLFSSRTSFSFFHFPYQSSCLHTRVYAAGELAEIFSFAAKNLGVPLEMCEIIVSSVYDIDPKLFSDIKNVNLVANTFELFSQATSFSTVFVSGANLFAVNQAIEGFPHFYADSLTTTQGNNKLAVDAEKQNFFSNQFIYPFVQTNNYTEQFDLDQVVRYMFSQIIYKFDQTKAIYFSGERFLNIEKMKTLGYLLILDLIKDTGFFDVRIDPSNKLPLVLALKKYKNSDPQFDLVSTSQLYFKNVGMVLNCSGSVECLFKSDAGTSQVIEVQPDSLFVHPLEAGESASIVVKGSNLKSTERRIQGGELGFVIDTREKNQQEPVLLGSGYQKYREWQKVLKDSFDRL